ncbi:GntR family transcriptional regulator [Aeromicrobium wangtongii]|uniref:GntR family transcriptional regulator n=1 Tax=Aeromicrobium wangtongii TaxID=2969247 RepID=UPI002017E81C|nr:GntR family transcriptional regulator [Aeromicrobium wangtongii]MCL3817901.1 GntR family transcriptional regulator [Aeromicrobium wangtongii]
MRGKFHVDETPPKYVAIAAELRERIRSEELNPHTLMPSERELGESHGVSRMTARQALSLLESEGLVYRKPPRGTFVSEPRVAFQIGSFTDQLSRVGKQPSAELIWSETRDLPAAVDAFDGDRAHAVQRLRFADDEPIALETSYFRRSLTPGLFERDLSGSLWHLLRDEYGIVPDRARATVRSVVLDSHSCTLLDIRAASPGILLTRRTFDTEGRCFEFAQDVYRADRAEFEIDAPLRPADGA